MGNETVNDLLERLSSARVDAAWGEFLALYSPIIKHVIRLHFEDADRAAECFSHVCGALSDDGFRRLRSFRPDGPARFKTWLMAIVSNLCVDWRRRQQGRVRPVRSVARLPDLDQQVYRCIYLHAMSRAQCRQVLLPRYPDLTEQQVAEINARLFKLLTPQQRWQLSVRTPALRPVACRAESADEDPPLQVQSPEAGPDELALESQEQRLLRDALAQLPAEQRLLLRLRYEQDLTLAEVARLTRQPDPFRANRQIHAALEALAGFMGEQRSRPNRKTR